MRLKRSQIAAILALACAWGVAGVLSIAAAEPGVPTRDEEIDRLLKLHMAERDTVRLILLPTAVTTKGGRFVEGLDAEDFSVSEDSIPQDIKYFAPREAGPVSIAFLLDLSGSMRSMGRLKRAKGAIRSVIESLAEGDRFGLIGFADRQVTWITDFTEDRDEFLTRLEVQRGYGKTALFDAVAAAPSLVADESTGRRALVLISDGIDNNSTMSVFRASRLARRVQVPLYTLGFTNLSEGMRAPGTKGSVLRVLEMLAQETGGTLFTVHSDKDLKTAIRRMTAELRSAYVIGYFSSQTSWNGRFRRVRVETTRNGAVARTRRGYYAHP